MSRRYRNEPRYPFTLQPSQIWPREILTRARTLSTDGIFELLSPHRRRALLDVLRAHDEPLALADVAEEISVRERDARIDAIPADDVKRIYMLLYHRHVQKLADQGVVAYDQDRDMVALTDEADHLIPILESVNDTAGVGHAA